MEISSDATAMNLALKQLYPEGTGATGVAAMGGIRSEYAGSMQTVMSLLNSDLPVEKFERHTLLPSIKADNILDKISSPDTQYIAIANFYNPDDISTCLLHDYRDDKKEYQVASNSPHALSILEITNNHVTLLDPTKPNQPVQVSRKEFCKKVQYIEYCNLNANS